MSSLVLNSVEINVVIMAACVPAIRPLYLILFHRPGAEHYRKSSRQKPSYRRHFSWYDTPRKRRGPDTELISSGTGWNTSALVGTDGDGEGLVKQGDMTVRNTMELDATYDSETGSADAEQGRPGRSGQRGWR